MRGTHLKKHPNGVYYVHWTENGRSKRTSTGASVLPEAETFLAEHIRLAQRGAGPAGPALTVAELWAVDDAKHVEKNTAAPETIRYAWKNLGGFFGRMTPAAITQDAVDRYEAARLAGRIGGLVSQSGDARRPAKTSTVRRELNALLACLNWCADRRQKIIDPMTLPAFTLPAEGAARDRWLKRNEVQRLLDAARAMTSGKVIGRGELFLWIALETAARKTAILTLTWDRVDFETKVIHFKDPDQPETKKRRADVPISASLLPILQRAKDEARTNLVMTTDAEVWHLIQDIAHAAGFGAQATLDRLAGSPSKANRGHVARTGISPHVLRHTAATHMARRGVPLWTISKVLGNTLAMVEKVYAKHSPDDLRAAVGLISEGELV